MLRFCALFCIFLRLFLPGFVHKGLVLWLRSAIHTDLLREREREPTTSHGEFFNTHINITKFLTNIWREIRYTVEINYNH